jgi:hypothetical protein
LISVRRFSFWAFTSRSSSRGNPPGKGTVLKVEFSNSSI